MRVTGGTLRGRALVAPKDMRVRPTSDKVRQAIFNMLAHRDFGGAPGVGGTRVADLFAGTGALGIEALSRGARWCLFIEDDSESRALIRRNVEALGLTGVSKIWRRDAAAPGPLPAGAGGPFDLVFLDPPYRKGLAAAALAALARENWLAPGALAVAETAEDEDVPSVPGYAVLDTRCYGGTRVTFLRRE